MEQRALGRTGLTVSALGFGCGSIGGLMVRGDPAAQREAVARALDAGITYFDTAPQYGDGRSEENLGRTLRDLGAWQRVVVGTKVRLTEEDRAEPVAAVRRSVEHSLRRLARVDLLQLHNPVTDAESSRGALPADEILDAVAEGMRRVIDAGLVRFAGLTGLGDAAAVRRVIASGSFATVQSYVNALNPSAGFPGATGNGQDFAGLIRDAAAAGMGVIAIRVLAAGALSGTDQRAENAGNPGGTPLAAGGEFERDVARAHRLAGLASGLGLDSTVELGLRFVLSVPGVSTALAGVSNLDQLNDAVRWAERGPLTHEAADRVVEAAR